MNEVPQESKDAVMKTLAIIGFLAMVAIGVVLAVKIVEYTPSAFTSLASLADSVYNQNQSDEPETIAVSQSATLINTGESLTISFEPLDETGDYSIVFDCVDGTALNQVTDEDGTKNITCGEPMSIPAFTSEVEVVITSERRRFVDVPYTLSFVSTNTLGSTTEVTTENAVTILNTNIPSSVAMEEESAEPTEVVEEPVAEEPAEVVTPEPTPAEPETTPTVPVTPFVDLGVRLQAVGILNGNDFVPTGNVDNDDRGAFQFVVENNGTIPSAPWTFAATFTSGAKYNSDVQTPLQPGEFAVMTVGFDNVGEPGTQRFGVTINTGIDSDVTNNNFTWAVEVTE